MPASALAGLPVSDRLRQQIGFIVEIDKLKQVHRQTLLMDGSRAETGAEHSWHLAVMVLLLAEHAAAPDLDIGKVIRLVLVHDLVEIDAGDALPYDADAMRGQAERERAAADRLFALLPADQASMFRALWEEFEAGATPEAAFALAIDRLQPLLHNHRTGGAKWRELGVTADQVRRRQAAIEAGSPALFALAVDLIDDAVALGFLPR